MAKNFELSKRFIIGSTYFFKSGNLKTVKIFLNLHQNTFRKYKVLLSQTIKSTK